MPTISWKMTSNKKHGKKSDNNHAFPRSYRDIRLVSACVNLNKFIRVTFPSHFVRPFNLRAQSIILEHIKRIILFAGIYS